MHTCAFCACALHVYALCVLCFPGIPLARWLLAPGWMMSPRLIYHNQLSNAEYKAMLSYCVFGMQGVMLRSCVCRWEIGETTMSYGASGTLSRE